MRDLILSMNLRRINFSFYLMHIYIYIYIKNNSPEFCSLLFLLLTVSSSDFNSVRDFRFAAFNFAINSLRSSLSLDLFTCKLIDIVSSSIIDIDPETGKEKRALPASNRIAMILIIVPRRD